MYCEGNHQAMSYTVWFGEAGGLLLKLNGDQEQSTGMSGHQVQEQQM